MFQVISSFSNDKKTLQLVVWINTFGNAFLKNRFDCHIVRGELFSTVDSNDDRDYILVM